MSTSDGDNAFTGSIPDCYENYLVPLIFEPYALDLAKRVAALALQRVLEIAAGTGVVTRQLAIQLPLDTTIVATDLNQPMLELAVRRGTASMSGCASSASCSSRRTSSPSYADSQARWQAPPQSVQQLYFLLQAANGT